MNKFNYEEILKNGHLKKEYLKECEFYEMCPDVYGGEEMNYHIPMWNGYCYGDMGDESFS